MAFTKSKSKPAPARASYAKKKMKEEEVQEQEEIIEEQDDYTEEEQETEAPERPMRQARPSFSQPQTRTASTSYGNRSPRGNDGERKALRLTGLFAGKREGLFSGRLRDEDAENLKALIEEAQSSGQQISFFLWENQQGPQFSLTANIAAPKSFGGGGFRRGGFRR